MLDIKFLRQNPDVVKENIKKKFQDEKLPLVDEVIELDKRNREIKGEVEALRAEKNKVSKEIGACMAHGEKEKAEELKKKVQENAARMEELSVEEIEGKMDSVEEAHQKFAWIQPKAEKLMPVAASVLVVYVLTQKPQWYEKVKDKVVAITGDASAKAGVYIEMAKLFIASKLNIDLDDEAQAKKFKTFALLAATIGLCAFLYGKGVFNTEEDQSFMEKNPQLKAFIEQAKEIMEKILPTAFSAVTTYMVTKHIIDAKDEESNLEAEKKNAVDTDFTEVKEETAE